MRHVTTALALALAFTATGCGRSPLASSVAPKILAAASTSVGNLPASRNLIYNTIAVLGIGPVAEAALAGLGIKTVAQLLDQGGTRTQRARLAKATGLSEVRLLTWVNHADLMRTTGCGPEYSRLLELAGVDTIVELSKRDPGNLAKALATANDLGAGKVAVNRLPDVGTTTKWIANAKTFDRMVSY